MSSRTPTIASSSANSELGTELIIDRLYEQYRRDLAKSSERFDAGIHEEMERVEFSHLLANVKAKAKTAQIDVLRAALADKRDGEDHSRWCFRTCELPKALINGSDLLEEEAVLEELLSAATRDRFFVREHFDWAGCAGISLVSVIKAAEDLAAMQPLTKRTRDLLGVIGDRLRNKKAPAARFKERIERLRCPDVDRQGLPPGRFAQDFLTRIDNLDAGRNWWLEFAQVAARSGNKAVPSSKWLGDAIKASDQVERPQLISEIGNWLEWKQSERSYDLSLDILKGFLRLVPLMESSQLIAPLSRFCERLFKWAGPRSAELGSVALRALFEMRDDDTATAELLRLNSAIRHAIGRKILDPMIETVLQQRELSLEQLEDVFLPTYGLTPSSTLVQRFENSTATLTLSAVGTSIDWTGPSGKTVRSVPADAKRASKDELAAFRRKVSSVETARKAQARRLERSWLHERIWTLADWRERYLEHPIRRPLVSALIWLVEHDGRALTIVPNGSRLLDRMGMEVEAPEPAKIRLWHPLDSTIEEVLAWRAHIEMRGVRQPFKQAHREVYVLTDAERQTRTYSNRFAAHILKNQQFSQLCKAQDWYYNSFYDLDLEHSAWKMLDKPGYVGGLELKLLEGGPVTERSGAPVYVTTDRVTITPPDDKEPLLERVPAAIFSEIMRDVDMFIAVTSIANDPTWSDDGEDERCNAYWQEWAFGELGQTAQIRRDMISRIAPTLVIADRLEIGEKALIVTGKRHRYAIHFGSTNVQILPDKRYLCLVPDGAVPAAARLHLPFAGDSQTSTILAKAFMLVDEDRITDRTITNQL